MDVELLLCNDIRSYKLRSKVIISGGHTSSVWIKMLMDLKPQLTSGHQVANAMFVETCHPLGSYTTVDHQGVLWSINAMLHLGNVDDETSSRPHLILARSFEGERGGKKSPAAPRDHTLLHHSIKGPCIVSLIPAKDPHEWGHPSTKSDN